jgi:MoaA/NifB/PqqE/SkfB family radical SAM enzyme
MSVAIEARGNGSIARAAVNSVRRRQTLARFLTQQAAQNQLQRLSIRTGKLLCRPTAIYVALTSRCDAHCAMCDMWKREPIEELPTAAWTDALLALRQWLGPYHVNFNGGEAYLRGDFVELLRFCADHDILAGFITNAFHMSREVARETVRAEPFNISISLDGIQPRTHDALRGHRGAYEKVMEGLEHITEFKNAYQTRSRVIIKSTVMRQNVAELPSLARWVEQRGDLAIYFQPVIPLWSKGARRQFGLDIAVLDEVVEELIAMKRAGAPILNAIGTLKLFKPYFRDENLAEVGRDVCYVGVKNMFFHPDGGVYLCEHAFGDVGNIRDDSPETIWKSARAAEVRSKTVACQRPCLQTCIVKRSLTDNFDLFRNLLLRA